MVSDLAHIGHRHFVEVERVELPVEEVEGTFRFRDDRGPRGLFSR